MPQIVPIEAQSKQNNCGAYALTAIAKAFKILPVSSEIILEHDSRRSSITPGQTDVEVAASIYKITGNLNSNGTYTSSHNDTSSHNGQNSPSALSYVAKRLNLAVDVRLTREGYKELAPTYKEELSRCKKEASSVNYSCTSYTAPSDAEIHMLCVMNSDKSLHWIAHGTQKRYYDPAVGKKLFDWDSPGNFRDPVGENYQWAGLWVSFRRR